MTKTLLVIFEKPDEEKTLFPKGCNLKTRMTKTLFVIFEKPDEEKLFDAEGGFFGKKSSTRTEKNLTL